MIEHEMNLINSKRIDKNQHEWYSIDKKLGRITRLRAVFVSYAVRVGIRLFSGIIKSRKGKNQTRRL